MAEKMTEALANEMMDQGYHCSQVVLMHAAELLGRDKDEALRISSGLGGGLFHGEVCGTVSGALLVLGIVCGYDDPKAGQAKTDHYHLVQEFVRRFREINGTILCRELLEGVKTQPGNDPEARTPEYYARRPCLRHVGEAARIVDELLSEPSVFPKR